MFSIWLDKNWPRAIWMFNLALAGLVIAGTMIDIYAVEIGLPLGLLRFLQFICLVVTPFFAFRQEFSQRFFLERARRHPAFRAAIQNNAAQLSAQLAKSPALASANLSDGSSLLVAAAIKGSAAMVKAVINAGVKSPEVLVEGLLAAAHSGNEECYKLIRAKLTDEELVAGCANANYPLLHIHAFEGSVEKARAIATHGNATKPDAWGFTPLHMAVLGARNRSVVEGLIELGADANALTAMMLMNDGAEAHDIQQFSPLVLALVRKDPELALFFLTRSQRALRAGKEKDHMMFACQLGLDMYVQAVMDLYDWNTVDAKGKTALDYARAAGQQKIVSAITAHLKTQAANAANQSAASSSAPSLKVPASVAAPGVASLSADDIDLKVAQSLDGMVGLEGFISTFAHTFHDFLKKTPGNSKGIIIWGDVATGKTEIAKRFAGLRQFDYKVPGLDFDGIEVKYVGCCDGDFDVVKIANEAPAKSVIILDEIDKYLNPASGFVDEARAKKLRASINSNFDNKPLLWVFMGSFVDVRAKNGLTDTELLKVLDRNLLSRFSYAGWRLPNWTLANLLTVANERFFKHDQARVEYDDDAAIALVNDAVESGGGLHALEKMHEHFVLQASLAGSLIKVGAPEAGALLKDRNAG